jgi:hypothetical protein
MMQEVYLKKAYPSEALRAVLNSGRLGIELANRWMLGWPEGVQRLIAAGEFVDAFKNQLEQEKDALASAQDSSHLAPMEIIAMAGLAMGPPTIS